VSASWLVLGAALFGGAALHQMLPSRPLLSSTSVGSADRIVRLLSGAGRRLRPGAAGATGLDGRIAAAGLVGHMARVGPREVMAAKLGAAGIAAALALPVGALLPGRLGIAAALAGPVAGFLAPDAWLRRRGGERARVVRRELPAMLDLLRVSVEAGQPLPDALLAVGERSGGALGAEWRSVGREAGLGVPLDQSLAQLERRLPLPEISSLIAALERSARHGSPLAETLAAQARDARLARRRRIQEEAARAGPKIQLVVALLLVPSVLLLVGAALAAALIDSGGGLGVV